MCGSMSIAAYKKQKPYRFDSDTLVHTVHLFCRVVIEEQYASLRQRAFKVFSVFISSREVTVHRNNYKINFLICILHGWNMCKLKKKKKTKNQFFLRFDSMRD